MCSTDKHCKGKPDTGGKPTTVCDSENRKCVNCLSDKDCKTAGLKNKEGEPLQYCDTKKNECAICVQNKSHDGCDPGERCKRNKGVLYCKKKGGR